LGDRRNVGESSCNSGDGTGQMAQPLMLMMMMMILFCSVDATGQLLIIFCTCPILEEKWKYNEAVHQLFVYFKKAYNSVRRVVFPLSLVSR
jgi:hypothetical protein